MKKKTATRISFKKRLAKLFDESDEPLGRKMATDELLKYHGVDPRKPDTYKEAIVELIDADILFNVGFSGFENGVLKVFSILADYEINPKSKTGQFILKTYVENALDEEYGDFDRSVDCQKCGAAFNPDFSLAYANRVLAYEGAVCDKCCRKKAR